MSPDLRRRTTALSAVLLLLGLTQLPASAAVTSVYVGSFYFSTSSGGPDNTPVTVDNGDQLRFVAQDNGHTVEIPGLGISQALAKGQTFTTGALMKAGTYALYCSPHRNRGHETTLTVRAASQQPSPEPPPPPPSPPSPESSAESSPESSAEPRPSPTAKASAAPVRTTATTASSALTAGRPTPSPAPDTAGSPAAPAPGTSPSADEPVAGGLGTASEDEVAVPAAEGPLEDLLGRPAAKEGTWTRSVWLATGLLLPMIALAGWALARRERAPAEPEQP